MKNDGLRHYFLFEMFDNFINQLNEKIIKPYRKKIKHDLNISRYPLKASRKHIKKNGKSRSTL